MNSAFITHTLKQIFNSHPLESDTFSPLLNRIVLRPLAHFYIYGPTWLGMWGGKHAHDICAQLTHTPSDVWIRNREECMAIIGKSFYSIVVVVETLFYMGLVYKGIKLFWGFCWLVGSLVYRRIKRGFEKREKVGKLFSSFSHTVEGGGGTRNGGKNKSFTCKIEDDSNTS